VTTSIGTCHKIGPFPSNSGVHKDTYACVYADNVRMDDYGHSKVGDELLANARLIAAAPCLLKALQSLIPQAMTGNPTHAAQVEFWTSEKAAGRGEAGDVLFALDAISRATAQQPDSTR
jgi:hypothetical protein